MNQELGSLTLQISPNSLGKGEQAILKEIALQLYALDIFTLGQARRLANTKSAIARPHIILDRFYAFDCIHSLIAGL